MKKIIFFAFILLFSFQIQAQNEVVVDKIIAKIDNHIILKSDLEMAYQSYISRGRSGENITRCQVLQQLLLNKVLYAKAELDSVIVEEETLNQQLEGRMQQIIMNSGVSEDKIESHLGMSLAALKEEMRPDVKEQMTAQKMQRKITEDIKVTPNQVKKFFGMFPADSVPFLPSEYEVSQIVKLPEVSKSVKEQVRLQLMEVREKILKGEKFEKMASIYSEDLATATRGGALGWFGRGQLAPEYEATSLSIKVGDISEPVLSDFGFHIIQLLDRRGNRFNTRHILIRPKSTTEDLKRTEIFLDSLRGVILKDSLKFEKAASLYSTDKSTKMNGGAFKDPETGNNSLTRDFFDYVVGQTLDTLKVGGISRPLEYRTEDGKSALRLIYFRKQIAGHKASFKEDYEKLYQAALSEEKNKKIADWFQRVRGELFIDIDPEYDNCGLMEEF